MRKHILPLLLLSSVVSGCGAPEADEPEALLGADGKADGAGPSPVSMTVLRDPQLPRALLDRGIYQMFTTGSEYRRVTGHDLPGVAWSNYEWVVLYAPGRAQLWSTPGLEVRSSDRVRFTVVRKLNRPGRACATPDFPEAAGPYSLVKFQASRNARLGYTTWRDDAILWPCQGPVSWGCVNTGCASGQVCRLTDGRGVCISPPQSCDMVVCGPGYRCGYRSDRAACVYTGWGGGNDTVSIPDHRAPFDLSDNGGHPVCVSLTGESSCENEVISFPTNPPIDLSCSFLTCNPGFVCKSGSCVKPTTGGGPGPVN